MFNVLNLVDGEIYLNNKEEPHTWETGKEVKEFCDSYNRIFHEGKKILEPRKMIVNKNWREREAEKFKNGHYTLPEFLKPYGKADHFLHISSDKLRLAYTKDDLRGSQNVQTNISFEGYFEKYSPMTYTAYKPIKEKWELFLLERLGLKIAMTPEEIVHVYTHFSGYEDGVSSSCMRGQFTRLPKHPTSVYGAGDLGIAYVQKDGATVARALVWPEKKIYSRVYGREIIHQALKSSGYEKGAYYGGTSFAGAKLLKIKVGRGFLMPYMDEVNLRAVEKGEFLVLERSTPVNTRYSHGTTSSGQEVACNRCSTFMEDPSDIMTLHTRGGAGVHWCRACVRIYSFTCQKSGQRFELRTDLPGFKEEDYRIQMAHGEVWSWFNFQRYGFICQKTNTYRSKTQLRIVYTKISHINENWCSSALSEFGWTCYLTGYHYSNEVEHKLLDQIESTGLVHKVLESALIPKSHYKTKDGKTYRVKEGHVSAATLTPPSFENDLNKIVEQQRREQLSNNDYSNLLSYANGPLPSPLSRQGITQLNRIYPPWESYITAYRTGDTITQNTIFRGEITATQILYGDDPVLPPVQIEE